MSRTLIQLSIILLLPLITATTHAEYYLQLGSFRMRSGAEKVVSDLAGRGIQAVVVVHESADPSQGVWHKVRTVLSPDLDEVLGQKRVLEEQGLFKGIMVVDTAPSGAVRVNRKPAKAAPAAVVWSETEPVGDRNNLVRGKITRVGSIPEPARQERRVLQNGPANHATSAGAARLPEPFPPPLKVGSRDDRLNLLTPQVAMAATMPREPAASPARKGDDPTPTPGPPRQAVPSAPPAAQEGGEPSRVLASARPAQGSAASGPLKKEAEVSGLKSQSQKESADREARQQPGERPSAPSAHAARTSVLSRSQPGENKRDVTLKWDAIADPNVSGYRIYYDTNQGPVWDPAPEDCAAEGRPPVNVPKGRTEFTLHGLKASKDYYFSITAYRKGSNVETAYANGMIAPAVDIAARQAKGEPRGAKGQREKGRGLEQADLIAAGDILDIFVPGQKEMSRVYDVDPDGNIYLLVAGRVKASGINASELESALENQLSTMIAKGEKITVQLLSRERYIQIQTGVRYPGWYRVSQRTKLEDLIAMAGGTPVGADPSQAVLRRKTAGKIQETRVQGEISLDPDDVVVIPFPRGFDERIDAGDLIFVSIPEKEPPVRSQNVASYRIAEESRQNRIEVDKRGFLHVPQIGEFRINNRTPKEVTVMIKERLPKYLAHESAVEVNIVEKRHPVQVLGHVAQPGWHNVAEERNIQEVITAAGGVVDGAVLSEVSIQREWGGLQRNIRVNLYQFTITGDPRLLTPIHANDVVFVPISSAFGDVKRNLMPWQPPPERLEDDVKNKFKIFGAVHNPGVYEPKGDMTLLDAIVTAGGEVHTADMSRIVIVRQNRVEVKFNLEDYLGGIPGGRLPKIMRGDTIYISHVPMTYFEPKEDQVFYILGEVKRPHPPDPAQGYKLKDEMTVIQALSLAGGPTEWARVEQISIIRMVAGKQENIPFNMKRAIAGKYPEINVYVRPNDVIFVP